MPAISDIHVPFKYKGGLLGELILSVGEDKSLLEKTWSEPTLCSHIVCMHTHVIFNELQLPWLQTAIHHTGLNKVKVTQCTGRVSTNIRLHQLRWSDREWAYYAMYMYIHITLISGMTANTCSKQQQKHIHK